MANKKRKCRHCKDYFPMEQGIKVPLGWFCCSQHAAKHSLDKVMSDRVKKAKREQKVARDSVRPIGYWMKKAQAAFNAYIRERDKGLPCISCGKPDDGSHQRHASHYRSTGACPALRFHELNVWASCSVCNNHLSGNLAAYRVKLMDMIGPVKVEWLEKDHEPKRYRREDYQAIEAEYKAKLKQIKQESE